MTPDAWRHRPRLRQHSPPPGLAGVAGGQELKNHRITLSLPASMWAALQQYADLMGSSCSETTRTMICLAVRSLQDEETRRGMVWLVRRALPTFTPSSPEGRTLRDWLRHIVVSAVDVPLFPLDAPVPDDFGDPPAPPVPSDPRKEE